MSKEIEKKATKEKKKTTTAKPRKTPAKKQVKTVDVPWSNTAEDTSSAKKQPKTPEKSVPKKRVRVSSAKTIQEQEKLFNESSQDETKKDLVAEKIPTQEKTQDPRIQQATTTAKTIRQNELISNLNEKTEPAPKTRKPRRNIDNQDNYSDVQKTPEVQESYSKNHRAEREYKDREQKIREIRERDAKDRERNIRMRELKPRSRDSRDRDYRDRDRDRDSRDYRDNGNRDYRSSRDSRDRDYRSNRDNRDHRDSRDRDNYRDSQGLKDNDDYRDRKQPRRMDIQDDDLEAKYDEIKRKQENEKLGMNDLKLEELLKIAEDEGLQEFAGLAKADLINKIMSARARKEGLESVQGVLEILNDNYGFLRSVNNNYLSGQNDVYVSPSQIRRFGLQTGLELKGFARQPKGEEKYWAMLRIESINDKPPEEYTKITPFESLIPYFPTERLILETEPGTFETRIIDLISPVGKGQRGLIVSPPRAGKTIILQKIANAITTNNPEVKLIVLLIDERPEEVTDMKRSVKAEVISSTFDEPTSKHTKVAEMVNERAKKLVEYGHDVVILLDSITRLGRAFNSEAPKSNKILTGGVDSQALQRPKKFFGAARNIEGAGSLTIIATALIETGSKMDEVIFEEFKGTGNMELVLDRRLADKRIYPALDIKKSGTRKEELLMTPEEYRAVVDIRRQVYDMDDIEAIPLLVEKMSKYEKNVLFLLKGGLFRA